ncbi:hypothetical protein [Corynebacterium aquilae]|uniref:hypothetical protein n=1 Tax=Corynebacterium aquilae TaxID=203263 RepID=UPI0012EEC846|nr:hypothetical protein [Corynebacterium aquilae]
MSALLQVSNNPTKAREVHFPKFKPYPWTPDDANGNAYGHVNEGDEEAAFEYLLNL